MAKYRIHLLSLPVAQTTEEYALCGFTQMTRRFARLLKELGHTVMLYASEENDAPCDELVKIITKEEIETLLDGPANDPTPYQYAYIEEWSPIFQLANLRMIKEIWKRKEKGDFLCLIGGGSQAVVYNAHSDIPCIEYSIGYNGSFAPYRVFESHIWRHCTYGFQSIGPDGKLTKIIEGRFSDTVIPCFYDPDEFPFKSEKEPFTLYVGRLVERKGLLLACRAAEAAKVPLKVIGHGDKNLVTNGAEYLGALNSKERNEWMSRASAVFTPTTYLEPFNQVAIEAQMCGTPVISTDYGGFVETIEQGKTGYRCNYLGEFMRAAWDVRKLDPYYIRERAVRLYSFEAVKPQYQDFFDRVALLWEKSWETLETHKGE